jgi:4-amino-4-deoxy-L-arabinose transferase-like glycosyltransferase
MTQHPPGYYVVAAGLFKLVGAGGWRYDHALLLLRALSALIVAAVVPACCYLATRQVTGSEAAGRTAAFFPLLIPQLAYIGGAVNNDCAAIATAAIVWALLLTVTSSGPTTRRLILLGVALGVACWTKGTALTLLPAVPVAVAMAYRRTRGGSLRNWAVPAGIATAGCLGLAVVLGGWWWVVNLLRYGALQPPAVPTPLVEGQARDFAGFLLVFVQRLRWTLIAEVGGREPTVLYPMTVVLATGFAVLCLIGLISRRRFAERLVMLASILPTVGVLIETTYRAHQLTKGFPGIQGRYLFVLVVPVAVLFAAGVLRLAALVRMPTRWLPPAVALAAVAVALLGLTLAFQVYYSDGTSWGAAFDRFAAWAPVSPLVMAGLASAFGLSALTLAWVMGAGSGDESPPEQVNESTRPGTGAGAIRPTQVAGTA